MKKTEITITLYRIHLKRPKIYHLIHPCEIPFLNSYLQRESKQNVSNLKLDKMVFLTVIFNKHK